MKKGFTLIELLAVIVILAIIALIATPIVLNIINDTKESAGLRSAEMYLDAVEYIVLDIVKNNGELKSSNYYIMEDGNLCKEELLEDGSCAQGNVLTVDVKGEKPKSGSIFVENGKIKDIILNLSNKTVTKNLKGDLIYQATLTNSCKFKDGTEKTIGAKYECDFGAGVKKFYILELGTKPVTGSILKEDEVALILDGNYDITTQPWCDQSGPNLSNNVCNADGLTAKLDEIANAWTKLDRTQIVLPSIVQISVADGRSETEYKQYPTLTNSWLYTWSENEDYNNGKVRSYGYWTSTAHPNNSAATWRVAYTGYINLESVDVSKIYGVRPVINLKI